jgi:hypothetical protein
LFFILPYMKTYLSQHTQAQLFGIQQSQANHSGCIYGYHSSNRLL